MAIITKEITKLPSSEDLARGFAPWTASGDEGRLTEGETWVTEDMLDVFDESWTYEEYLEIIRICLRDYCGWCINLDDLDHLRQRMRKQEAYIRQEYMKHASPLDVAVEIGYSCG